MRKKPSSPYAELIEANKKILQEDGKYLDYSNLPKPYSQSFQQLTQFRIPQYFELLHRKNQKKTEIHQEFNQPNVNQNNNSSKSTLTQQFSISKKITIENNKKKALFDEQVLNCIIGEISSGSFNRANYTLNKILSSLPMSQLHQIHEAKQENIQTLIQQRSNKQTRMVTPKYNLRTDSQMAKFFGSSNIFPTLSTFRLKTSQ
ncbi:unnamed protein product (macronuclear) [Paramecium tetraurelia]|uniref:Uncharacterized protein n=1 Tax=Paramecium tetraurelia TaxID=5888 RepID=A0ECG0_PARTE|nr:uncharacterized protein GSPATT00003846001 [Paramecium tetraurelia]CAK92977.1 unnamed protein product [Paramecium tetraurelia]|eukprot:XP_001460374.1 hypothetical protein (macronuclear) [Paramecium tetraurelia strain d4-2]